MSRNGWIAVNCGIFFEDYTNWSTLPANLPVSRGVSVRAPPSLVSAIEWAPDHICSPRAYQVLTQALRIVVALDAGAAKLRCPRRCAGGGAFRSWRRHWYAVWRADWAGALASASGLLGTVARCNRQEIGRALKQRAA